MIKDNKRLMENKWFFEKNFDLFWRFVGLFCFDFVLFLLFVILLCFFELIVVCGCVIRQRGIRRFGKFLHVFLFFCKIPMMKWPCLWKTLMVFKHE
jgi:hypothetical protein